MSHSNLSDYVQAVKGTYFFERTMTYKYFINIKKVDEEVN